MRTSIITTVRHNIGDDFVREGILHLLSIASPIVDIDLIHKHSPVTAVYGLEKLRSRYLSLAVEPLTRMVGAKDRIETTDLLVQSGAPVYWCHPGGPHCGSSEWFGPLIRKRFLKNRRGRKFLNLAGGSCQRYHSDGSEVGTCPKCGPFIQEFFDACDLTVLRDGLAKTMLNKLGRNAEVLPCTSIFARDRLNLKPLEGEYIVLNFMESGGHYTFGQTIDKAAWRMQFKAIAQAVKKMGRTVIACHTEKEKQLAAQLVPELERFLVPHEHVEFMKFYARAKFGVVNRVHAGFMMASLGKPVTVIGNDSRALMINNLNLKSYFVNDIKPDNIDSIINDVRNRTGSYPEEIEEIRRATQDRYVNLISAAVL